MHLSSRRAMRLAAFAAVAIGLMPAGEAVAQSETSGPALSLDEVRACLCFEQEIADLRRETELQESLRQEREAELNQIDRQIEQGRATINVSDPVAVESLQRLVARQQMLRDLMRTDIQQPHRENVRQLNTKVAAYNEQCTTRPMFKLDIDRAKQNLQCPIP